jgi:hypothetical protein
MDENFAQISYLLAVITVVILLLVLLLVNLMLTARNRRIRHKAELEQIASEIREQIAVVRVEVAEATLGDVSRDLHDEVGQLLTFSILQMENLSNKSVEEQQPMIQEVKKTVRDALDSLRSISRGLNPDFVHQQGLVKSIEQLLSRAQSRTGIKSSINVSPNFLLAAPSHAVIIFRILRECLTNAIRHGKATRIYVSISSSDRSTEVSFSDNGLGNHDINSPKHSLGWKNMQHYAGLIHATITFKNGKDAGTEILLIIPNPAN